MARDVLHHHDGVVHQNADREDQREQCDAVQRIAINEVNEQRQSQGHGHCPQHHHRRAPAQRQGDESRDREGGKQEVFQQLIGFVLGRLAVVSCDRHFNAGRDDGCLQALHFLKGAICDHDGVLTLPLGDGDSYGREVAGVASDLFGSPSPETQEDVISGLLGPVPNLRYIPQVDGTPGGDANDHLPHLVDIDQEVAGLDRVFLVGGSELTCLEALVGSLHGGQDGCRRHAEARHLRGIKEGANLSSLTSDELRLRNVVYALDFALNLSSNATQRVAVVAAAPEGERQDGYVVDGARFDQGPRGAGWDQVEMGIEFVVQLDDGVFFLLAHLVPHDHHAQSGPGDGIYILHPRYLPDELLHGRRNAIFHFFSGRTGHLHEHIHHGNDDLRLFFAGRLEHGEGPQEDGKDHDQGGEFRVDEVVGDAASETQSIVRHGETNNSACAAVCVSGRGFSQASAVPIVGG